jgi:hypothetical protein
LVRAWISIGAKEIGLKPEVDPDFGPILYQTRPKGSHEMTREKIRAGGLMATELDRIREERALHSAAKLTPATRAR